MANVSLTSYDAQLADAQRRQKMAEMLQAQANAPFDIQSYKNIQAPIPFTAVLAKALQGGLAGYQSKKAETQEADAKQQARATALAELMKPDTVVSGGYNVPDKNAPAVTGQGLKNFFNQQSAPTAQMGMDANTSTAGIPTAAPVPPPRLIAGGDVPRTERPMTGQERLNRGYKLGMSGNPILEAAAPDLIKKAQETVGVERFMSGLGPIHESVKTQLAPYAVNGDLAGVQKVYGELTKPMTVGSTVQKLNLTTGELGSLVDLRERWKKVDRLTMTKAESDTIPPGQIMLQSSNGDIKYLNPSDANSVLRIQQESDAKAPERAIAQSQLEVAQAGLNLRRQEFEFNKLKGKVPPKVLAGYTVNENAIKEIDDAMKAITENPGHLGLRNIAGDAVMQRLDPKGVSVRARLAKITAIRRHDLSGASVTYKETPYLAPFLPNQTDEDSAALTKLEELKNQFVSSNSQIEASYGAPSGSNASEGWGEAVARKP